MLTALAVESTDLKCNVLSFPITIQPQDKPLMLPGLLSQVLLQLILVLLTAAPSLKHADLVLAAHLQAHEGYFRFQLPAFLRERSKCHPDVCRALLKFRKQASSPAERF